MRATHSARAWKRAAAVAALLMSTAGAAGAAYCEPYCGTPVSGEAVPVAVDCLFILKAAVGAETCTPECVCRVSGAETISAVDALTCLRSVVGPAEPLACHCEPSTTTTTIEPPTGVCTLSKIACHSLFDCEEKCLGDCEQKRDGCYVFAANEFDDCMVDCEPGDTLCFRLCLLHRRNIEVTCDRNLEDCVFPCDGELCGGMHDGPRFEDTGDTIIDHQTRLEWEKKTPANAAMSYTWSASAGSTKANGTIFTTLLAGLNDCHSEAGCLGGHCDWRLPSSSGERTTGKRAELESLRREMFCSIGETCVDPDFGPVRGAAYWSGTTYKDARNAAWTIQFAPVTPLIRVQSKSRSLATRAVREYRGD